MSRSRRSISPAILAVLVAACSGTAASPTATPSVAPTLTSTPSQADATASPSDADSPAASASAAAEQVTVEMDGSDFLPDELTIAVGTEVAFVNVSDFEHTVTEGSGGRAVEDPFVDEQVAGGDRAVVTFDEVGTFEITCRIHPTMELTITVEG